MKHTERRNNIHICTGGKYFRRCPQIDTVDIIFCMDVRGWVGFNVVIISYR